MQDPASVTLWISVPQGTRSSQVECVIGKQHLRVGLRGSSDMLEGTLFAPVVASDCMWSIRE